MLDSKEGEVVFKKGNLVQVYRNNLAKLIGSECKLTPMWSEPHRVVERILNSYTLESLDRQLLEGEYHVRRLREFKHREGTELAMQQKEVEARENTNKEIATNPTEHTADTEDDKEVLEEGEEEITELEEEVGS